MQLAITNGVVFVPGMVTMIVSASRTTSTRKSLPFSDSMPHASSLRLSGPAPQFPVSQEGGTGPNQPREVCAVRAG
jgi:hypothetical protein